MSRGTIHLFSSGLQSGNYYTQPQRCIWPMLSSAGGVNVFPVFDLNTDHAAEYLSVVTEYRRSLIRFTSAAFNPGMQSEYR